MDSHTDVPLLLVGINLQKKKFFGSTLKIAKYKQTKTIQNIFIYIYILYLYIFIIYSF